MIVTLFSIPTTHGNHIKSGISSRTQSLMDTCYLYGLRWVQMTPVGFEPTQLALVELESTPLDHSGKVS